MRLICLILLLGICMGPSAFGYSYSTPDGSCMSLVMLYVEEYERRFGSVPSSWADVDKILTLPIESPVQPQERYAFLPAGSRPKLKGKKAEIIFLSRRPFRNLTKREIIPGILPGLRRTQLTEPLRYGLCRYEDGRLGACVLPESEVQSIFKSQAMPLPAPDALPERPWVAAVERRNRRTNIAVVTLSLGTFGFLLGTIYLRRKRHFTSGISFLISGIA